MAMTARDFLKTFNVKESELRTFLQNNMSETAFTNLELNATQELVDIMYLQLCDDFGGPDYTSVETYLKETLIPKNVNIYDLYNRNNYDNVVSDIIHEVAGYLGTNLNDEDFTTLLDWVDCDLKFSDYYTIISYELAGYTLECPEVRRYLDTFCSMRNFDINKLCKFPPYSRTIAEFAINSEKEFVYVILNTDLYGMPATTIVECSTPEALDKYGFDVDEIKELKSLEVGELFESNDYGKAVVIVRMK